MEFGGRGGRLSAAVREMQERVQRTGTVAFLGGLNDVRRCGRQRRIANLDVLSRGCVGDFVQFSQRRGDRAQRHRQRQDRECDQARCGGPAAAESELHFARIAGPRQRTLFHLAWRRVAGLRAGFFAVVFLFGAVSFAAMKSRTCGYTWVRQRLPLKMP